MFFQRILAWALLSAALAASAYGIWAGGWLAQAVWEPQGASGMAVFSAVYAAAAALLAWFAPHWLAPAVAGLMAAYSLVAAGPFAVAGTAAALLACLATGAAWMRGRRPEEAGAPAALAALGLGVWIALISVLARFKVHYWPVYLVLIAAVIVWGWSRQAFPAMRGLLPVSREEALAFALPGLPLTLQWLMALKPETSPEALSIHLTVPARMAALHRWSFDPAEFLWALKPMGGEWAFTMPYLLGGEAAARLFNWSLMALLCWLLYAWLRALLPPLLAGLLAAAFASLPVSLQMASALRPENVAALLFAAALYFANRNLAGGAVAAGCAAALLTGVSAATALGALGFAALLALAACLAAEWPMLLRGAPLALVPGALPYLSAWQATGNPVFPHLNQYFRSQLVDSSAPLAIPGALEPLSLTGWFDLTFHTARFLPGLNGGFGLVLFLFAPLCLAALRLDWPRAAFIALACWAFGLPLLGWAGGRAESAFIAAPALVMTMGFMLASLRQWGGLLPRASVAALAAAVCLQLYLTPAASPEHRGFALNQVFRPASVDEYLARWAPERPLVRELNRLAPAAKTLWLDSTAVAGFAGPVLTNTWQHYAFHQQLEAATSAEGYLFAAQELGLEYLIAPAADSPRPLSSVFTREFLDLYSKPHLRFGDMELRRFEPPAGGLAPLQLAYAPPGKHDEVNSYVRYEGPWRRTFEFPRAFRGSLAYTNDLRGRIYVRFQGRAITLLHTAAANRCTGVLFMDDAEVAGFKQFAEATRWQAASARLETAPGYHTLVIRLPQSRTTTTSLSECFLDFDGFIVE